MAAGLLRFLRRAIRTKGAVVHLLCASGNVEESGGQHSHSSWPAASDGIPVEPTKGRRHHVVGNGRKIDLAGVHLLSTISELRDLIHRPLARHGHLRASVVGRLTCNRGKIRKRAGGSRRVGGLSARGLICGIPSLTLFERLRAARLSASIVPFEAAPLKPVGWLPGGNAGAVEPSMTQESDVCLIRGWLVSAVAILDKHSIVEDTRTGRRFNVTPRAAGTPFFQHPGSAEEFDGLPAQISLPVYTPSAQS